MATARTATKPRRAGRTTRPTGSAPSPKSSTVSRLSAVPTRRSRQASTCRSNEVTSVVPLLPDRAATTASSSGTAAAVHSDAMGCQVSWLLASIVRLRTHTGCRRPPWSAFASPDRPVGRTAQRSTPSFRNHIVTKSRPRGRSAPGAVLHSLRTGLPACRPDHDPDRRRLMGKAPPQCHRSERDTGVRGPGWQPATGVAS
jgi:hypothetical protein